MTSYHEILRLSAQGISQRGIARSCDCSRNTVSRVLTQAQKQNLEWNKILNLSDGELYNLLFPVNIQAGSRKVPDCEYIHREMAAPLVRSMEGLAGGLGFTGDTCGTLTAGGGGARPVRRPGPRARTTRIRP